MTIAIRRSVNYGQTTGPSLPVQTDRSPSPLPSLEVERTLSRVRRPGRYAGGEWNSVAKDWDAVELTWCLAYPDLYEIGMSNLGLRILYEVLNDRPDLLAERCFAPDVDLQAELRARRLPLWSLETRHALRDFDVLGISLGYELTYTNLLDMLDLGGIALAAARRTDGEPLVIAGGSSVLNPEPVAEFLDAVVLGEGEEVVLEMSAALRQVGWAARGRRRATRGLPAVQGSALRTEALRQLARIPGVYVPSLYRPQYLADGSFERLEAIDEAAPGRVFGRIVSDFETTVRGVRQLVPNIAIVFDRAQLEVMRGCTRGCRFCQAGMGYRPVRERAPDVAVAAAKAMLRSTGYEELGLTSLSTADYTYAVEVSTALRREMPELTISLPSTRVDSLGIDLIDAVLPKARRGGFTLAPEAGSQRLRDVINKGVDDEEIARCAELAFGHGWTSLKLYFMLGLPGETMEDVLAIASVCRVALEVGRRHHGAKASVKANVSTFVPKVATPFQWCGQDTTEEIAIKVTALQKAMRGRGLELRWADPRTSILEAALGRGDRRLARVVERAWRNGARFDAWDQHFRFDAWQSAFAAEGLDPAWYAQRDIGLDEALPWEHLSCGVSREFLARELERAMAGRKLTDCHWGPCSDCGVAEAIGFACDEGRAGPRGLLVARETVDNSTGEESAKGELTPQWRFVGPPGDPRRAPQTGTEAGAPAGPSARMWPYNLLGTEMQSKSAGLSGLASLVEAAGGESTG